MFSSPRFPLFFFFFQPAIVDFVNCEQCICVLFTVLQITLFNKFFIKNGSHNTIYTFKNYFATVFSVSVFSFSKNKFNPNTPILRHPRQSRSPAPMVLRDPPRFTFCHLRSPPLLLQLLSLLRQPRCGATHPQVQLPELWKRRDFSFKTEKTFSAMESSTSTVSPESTKDKSLATNSAPNLSASSLKPLWTLSSLTA